MTTFYGDIETFCETPIQHGHYRYAETAEITVGSWAIDDGPVSVVDFSNPHFLSVAGDFLDALASADEVVFHNSMFDRTVLRANGVDIPLERWRDTFVQALCHGLPGGLEKLCGILNVPLDKRKLAAGKQLIQLFCKPRPKNAKIRRATRETHPAEWAEFLEYAKYDIEAMRAVHRKLPTWNYTGSELALWHLDQHINDRGFMVDVDMVAAAIRTAEREKRRLAKRTQELTNYDAETGEGVESATQRDKLLEYLLLAHGVALPDMTADTLERRLNDEELPASVRELIKVRLQASSASVHKFKAMLRSVCKDGRMRGTLQFCGAQRTGRWAGRLVQPQNFKRTPKYLSGDGAVEQAAEAIAVEAVDLLYENPLEVLSAGVPWAITAPKGKKLEVADLSNIEGRVLAWLAGEDWKLQAFREFDADRSNLAKDLYIIGYAKSFKEPIAEVVADAMANGKKRQVGKIQELFLGYQGAVGAYVTGAATYRLDLEDMARKAITTLDKKLEAKARAAWEKAQERKQIYGLPDFVYIVCQAHTYAWRGANQATVKFWYALEDAVRQAIRTPGSVFPVGRISIDRVANWLRIQLPNGHFLSYPSPRVDDETGKISYMGMNQYTRRWQRIETYGGKIAENVTQAIATGARGLIAAAMPGTEAAGYEIVLHNHDELVAEVPDTDAFTSDELVRLITTPPDWPGIEHLPLSAGGYETHRYRKD